MSATLTIQEIETMSIQDLDAYLDGAGLPEELQEIYEELADVQLRAFVLEHFLTQPVAVPEAREPNEVGLIDVENILGQRGALNPLDASRPLFGHDYFDNNPFQTLPRRDARGRFTGATSAHISATPEPVPETNGRPDFTAGNWFIIQGAENSFYENLGIPTTYQSFNGYVFAEEHLDKVVEALGINLDDYDMNGINVGNIFKYTKKPVATVRIQSWTGVDQAKYQKITEEMLLPVVNKDIDIYTPHGERRSPSFDDNKFFVRIFSSPINTYGTRHPETIFGLPVLQNHECFSSSGAGITIYDDDTNYEVAEVVKNNLYIHNDLCHSRSDEHLKVYRLILKEVIAILNKGYDVALAEYKVGLPLRSRPIYIQSCANRVIGRLNGIKKDIKSAEESMTEAHGIMVEAIKNRKFAKVLLKQAESIRDADVEDYGLEYDKLLTHKELTTVYLNQGNLHAETVPISIEYGDYIYNMGRYKIRIHLRSGSINIFNIDGNTFDRYQHPHIDSDGICCLGNMSVGISKLLGECQYSIVINMLVQYLKSANEDDWHRPLHEWSDYAVLKTDIKPEEAK